MIVLTLTDCPLSLKGDLTKWLIEINTGVYVGNVSARVRDHLWERIRQNAKNGRATLIYPAKNEQRMSFRVHNAVCEPIDFDGVTLMLRPSPERLQKGSAIKRGFSKAAQFKNVGRGVRSGPNDLPRNYVVIDIETTGLDYKKHDIIEIGALKVVEGKAQGAFQTLVKTDGNIQENVVSLTGISAKMLKDFGKEIKAAMLLTLEFIGTNPVVLHNAAFDHAFLRSACEDCGLEMYPGRTIDTLALAKKHVRGLKNYRLETLVRYLKISHEKFHRSAGDCQATMKLYEKLIEILETKK
jgi:CRISPR-associated protein Cas2